MNVIDLVVIVMILFGAYRGWKYGMFTSIVSLIGAVLLFVVSFYLKNPISKIMYTTLPFRDYGGLFQGVSSFNILIYEGLAYLIVMLILATILRYVLTITGIFDKFMKLTMVMAMPSKFIGFIVGGIQYYIFAFIMVFVCAQIPVTAKLVNTSDIAKPILQNTPLLSNITSNVYHAVSEVYDVCVLHEGEADEFALADYEALDVLLKYEIIDVDAAKRLIADRKLKISDPEPLYKKYSNRNNKVKETVESAYEEVKDRIVGSDNTNQENSEVNND